MSSPLTRLLLVSNILRLPTPSAALFSSFMGDMASKTKMVSQENALPGRTTKIKVSPKHTVLGNPTVEPFPDHVEHVQFGLGCFWGAERLFWKQEGVFSTQVGYSGGFTANPTYEETCTGQTGHTEVVRVQFDPAKVSYEQLLEVFWSSHDPTQGNRQGNDVGTQYRSAIYTYSDTQQATTEKSKVAYQQALQAKGFPEISTEIKPAGEFFYAEDYHQQYLDKNKGGYCGLKGTGVACPMPVKEL